MKSLILIIGLSFCTIRAYTQNEILPKAASVVTDEFILDSFYHWQWDTLSLDWTLNDRTLYTTDNNQNVTSETSIVLNSGQEWTNQSRTLYTFDENNNPTSDVDQDWGGTAWENVRQTVYAYDSNNDQTSIIFQNWDGAAWVNSLQQLFTYDNNHNPLTRISQHWSGIDWSNITQQFNTYDGENKLTLRLFQNWNAGWTDVSRSLYTYDANDDLDTLLYQRWLFNGWTDDYRNMYDFDDRHNRILILEQLAVGVNVWEDRDRYDYTYDQYDNITHLLYTSFENNAWYNVYQFNLINDDDQNRATEVFQTWENEWVNQDSTQYYYTNLTGAHDINDFQSFKLSPNPAYELLNIEFEKAFDALISVYTMQGIKVAELKVISENAAHIDISSWRSGQYVLVLRSGNNLLAKSFHKM